MSGNVQKCPMCKEWTRIVESIDGQYWERHDLPGKPKNEVCMQSGKPYVRAGRLTD